MKRKIWFIFVLALLFGTTSCNQMAKEDLIGNYRGQATYLYKHSAHNIGLKDQTEKNKGSIYIFKDKKNNLFVRTGEWNIKLSGITLAANGTLFSVPYQKIVGKEGGSVISVEGFGRFENGGVKYDGFYDKESNTLKFGYTTEIKYDYLLATKKVPVYCNFEFAKTQE